MSLETIAERYATALLEIGVEQNNLSTLTDEVVKLGEVFSESEDLRAIATSPQVSEKERTAVFNDVCQRLGAGLITKNVVSLLNDRNRLILLPLIARSLSRLADEKSGTVRASVTTASQLPESFYARIKTELEKSTGRKVLLERSVDPTLIAGVITRVGDNVVDGSLRTRLEVVKRAMLAS